MQQVCDAPAAPIADSRTVSGPIVTRFAHVWTIKNFPLVSTETSNILHSTAFSPPNSRDKWMIEVNLITEEKAPRRKVPSWATPWRPKVVPRRPQPAQMGVFVYLCKPEEAVPKEGLPKPKLSTTSSKKIVRASYSVCVLDKFDKPRYERQIVQREFCAGGSGYGASQFCKRAELLDDTQNVLGADQSLTIRVEITIVGNVQVTGTHKPSAYSIDDYEQHTAAAHFGKLFDNADSSDFVIVSKEMKDIKCHKLVLATRSPTFKAMIESDMNEKATSRVVLDDIAHDVLVHLVLFMYTDQLPQLLDEKVAQQLLIVADRYDVHKLRMLLEDFLMSRIVLDNVATMLVDADMSNSEKLKSACLDFMARNATQITTVKNWSDCLNRRPQLLKKAFAALAIHRNNE